MIVNTNTTTGGAFPGSPEVANVQKDVKANVSKAIKKFGPNEPPPSPSPHFQYLPLCGNFLDFIALF